VAPSIQITHAGTAPGLTLNRPDQLIARNGTMHRTLAAQLDLTPDYTENAPAFMETQAPEAPKKNGGKICELVWKGPVFRPDNQERS